MKRIIKANDYVDYDVMQGHRYRVVADDTGPFDEPNHPVVKFYDDPRKAIEAWFKLEPYNQLGTAIFTKYGSDTRALMEAASEPGFLDSLDAKYNISYDIEWMKSAVDQKLANGVFRDEKYPDQVYPFCYG